MSDALETLRQELAEAQRTLARTQARFAVHVAESEATTRALEQAHQEWMAALDVVEDPIFMHDADFRILRCNRAYQRCAGMPFKQIIGRPYYEVFPKTPAPLRHCLRAMGQAPAGEDNDEEEVRVGDVVYRSRASVVHDGQGAYLYSVHTLEDITVRKRSQAQLAASHALLQTVVETTPIRVFWKDAELRYLGCNALFARDAGRSAPRELIGRDDFQMGWRDQAALYRADDQRVMDSGQPRLGFEEPQTTPDGRTIWLRTSKVPLRAADGKVIGVLGIYDDITERRQAEDRLKLFRALLDHSSDAIEVLDPVGLHFVDANETVCRDLGYSREELLSMHIADIDPSLSEDVSERIKAQIQQHGSARFEAVHRRKDGSTFPVEVSSKLIEIDRPYVVNIVRDISERKKAEIELLRLHRTLKTLSEGNRTLLRSGDEMALMQNMCDVTVAGGGYALAWIGLMRHDAGRRLEPVAIAGAGRTYVEALHLTWGDGPDGQGPAGIAARTGRTQVVQDTRNDPRVEPWRELVAKYGYASMIGLPLKNAGAVFGTLCIYATEASAFGAEEQALLEELAGDLAFGIVNQRTRAERDQAVQERQHYIEKLRASLEEALQAIAATVEMRDPYTAGHQRRVAQLAAAIARQLGLPEDQTHGIHLAGIAHDLGKIQIPSEILSKPGRLSALERSLIEIHPQAGHDILKGIHFPWPIAQAVLQHHERLDGSGYPQGLKGDAILLEARILAVADVVEAMSSHRPYRAGLGLEAALKEISAKSGTGFDPRVVEACVTLFHDGHFSFDD